MLLLALALLVAVSANTVSIHSFADFKDAFDKTLLEDTLLLFESSILLFPCAVINATARLPVTLTLAGPVSFVANGSCTLDVSFGGFSRVYLQDIGFNSTSISFSSSTGFFNHTTLRNCPSSCVHLEDSCNLTMHRTGVEEGNIGIGVSGDFVTIEVLDSAFGSLFRAIDASNVANLSVSISNSSFSSCSDSCFAMRGLTAPTIFLSDASFDCSFAVPAPTRGGALLIHSLLDGKVFIQNTNFSSCTASDAGGGMYIADIAGFANVAVKNARLEDCDAPYGAAIYAKVVSNSSSVTVMGSSFISLGRSAGVSGSAVFASTFTDRASLALENCTISDSEASTSGIGIYADHFSDLSSVTISRVLFQRLGLATLTSAVSGVGVHLSHFAGSSAARVVHSKLSDLSGFGNGGAISANLFSGATLDIHGTIFSRIGHVGLVRSMCLIVLLQTALLRVGLGGAIALTTFEAGAVVRIADSTFESCDAHHSGSGIYAGSFLSASELQIRNCSFSHLGMRWIPQTGGAILATVFDGNAMLIVSDSVFDDVTASVSGAGLSVDSFTRNSSVLLSENSFSNIAATAVQGGALCVSAFQASLVLLSGGRISACDAVKEGGGLFAKDFSFSRLVLESVEFSANGQVGFGFYSRDSPSLQKAQFGGSLSATQFADDSAVEVLNCSFFSSKAAQSGGALEISNVASISVNGSTFDGCSAGQSGGSIDLRGVHHFLCHGCQIANSKTLSGGVGSGGGDISSSSSILDILSSEFSSSLSLSDGGSVLLSEQSTGTFTDVSWRNSSCAGRGGSVRASGADLSLNNCSFHQCEAQKSGGGVSASSSSLSAVKIVATDVFGFEGGLFSIDDCPSVFLSNLSARNCTAGTSGGALAVKNTAALCAIASSNFSRCHASQGGAMIFSDSFCNLTAVFVSGSDSVSGGGAILVNSNCILSFQSLAVDRCVAGTVGGGLSVLAGSSVTLTRATLQDCSSGSDGGALFADSGAVVVAKDSKCLQNKAGGGGGCIFAASASTIVLNDTTISRCSAGKDGGGFHVEALSAHRLVVEACVAAESAGGGRIRSRDSLSSKVVGSGFLRNRATQFAGALFVDAGIALELDSTDVFNDNSALFGGAVYIDSKNVPIGLLASAHGGNSALQGDFCASAPVHLVLSSVWLSIRSGVPFSLAVNVFDVFWNPSWTITDPIITIATVSGARASISGAETKLVNASAVFPALEIIDHPGGTGNLTVTSDQMSVDVPYEMLNCSSGEILQQDRCVLCQYGSFSISPYDTVCSTCPAGAVCVNGSTILPRWGHWQPKSYPKGVCGPDGCSLPQCDVNDACHGTASLELVASSISILGKGRSATFAISDGCSGALQAAVPRSARVLLDYTKWMTLLSINCTGHTGVVLIAGADWSVSLGLSVLSAEVFVEDQCSTGYSGRLCRRCRASYGRSGDTECKKCYSRPVTLIFAAFELVIGVVLVGILVAVTLRTAGKKKSQLVSIGKLLLSYLQLMALCAHIPMRWPASITALFRVQDTASSVNSPHMVSMDCLLQACGMDHRRALLPRAGFLLLLPLFFVAVAALLWRFCLRSYVHRRYAKAMDPTAAQALLAEPGAIDAGGVVSTVDCFWITVLTVLFLAYPALCHTAFSLFPCQELGGGESFMVFDLDVSCSGSGYSARWILGLVGVLVYVAGVPALSFYLVWRRRLTLHTQYARNSVGFLYLGYSERCYWFESVVLLKKALFGALVLFGRSSNTEMIAVLGLVLFFVTYVMQIELKPFEEDTADRLERLSAVGIIVMMQAGMLFHSGALPAWMRVCIIAVLLLFNFLYVLLACSEAIRAWRASKPGFQEEVQLSRSEMQFDNTNPAV